MRIIKTFFKICFGLAFAVVATLGFVQTDYGQKLVLKPLLRFVEEKTRAKVQIEHVDYIFPNQLHAQQVHVSLDDNSISAQELRLCFRLEELWEGRITCTSIVGKSIVVSPAAHLPQGFNLDQIVIDLDQEIGPFAGHFTATLATADQHASGNYHWTPTSGLQISAFTLAHPLASLSGSLNISPQGYIVIGELTGQIYVLGNLSLKSRIHGPLKAPTVQIELSSSHLEIENETIENFYATLELQPTEDGALEGIIAAEAKYQSHAVKLASPLRWDPQTGGGLRDVHLHVLDTELRGHLMLAASLQAVQGHLEGKEIAFAAATVNTFAIDSAFHLQDQQWPFAFSAEGTFRNDTLRLASAGSWHASKEDLRATLDELQGTIGSHPFYLSHPLQVNYQKESLNISPWHVIAEEAEFHGQLHLAKQLLSCNCTGKQFPAEWLATLLPDMPLKGKVAFTAELQGSTEDLQSKLEISLNTLQLSDTAYAQMPPIHGNIKLQSSRRGLSIDGILEGLGDSPVLLQGMTPLLLNLTSPYWSIDEQLPLEISLATEGRIDTLLPLVNPGAVNLTGKVKIALQARGNWLAPQLSGQLAFSAGTYESRSTGAIYKNIQAQLEADGTRLNLTQFSAADSRGGTLVATGSLHIDPTQQFPFQITLTPTHLAVVDSDDILLSGSGQLTLAGNQKGGKLEGTFEMERGIVRTDEEHATDIKTIDFTFVNLPADQRSASTQATPLNKKWPLEFNVAAKVPGTLEIQGKSFSSKWKGDIAVTGMPQELQLNGILRVVSGQYDLRGKIFTLTQGNIHFSGPLDKKTTLYIVASRELDRITAEIVVKGAPKNLAFHFRSNPPLSEREVLSYILFGRGIAGISTDEGAELTQSFRTLSASSTGGSDLLSRLRNNMGIDRLDFNAGDGANGDLSLEVGKYIRPGLLVIMNKGLNAAANQVAIEAELRKNIKARGELGDDGQGRMMLKWKKDY